MNSNDTPIANPTVVLREEFDDWAVLFDPETGDAYGLNPTAVLIWKLLDGEHTMDALLQEVRGHADRVPDDAADHIGSFVDLLAAQGLVGLDCTGHTAEKYACFPPPQPDGLKPITYELPGLISLNSDQAAFGATCSTGSAANNCCSTGNLATSYCYVGSGRSNAGECCAGTCGYPPGCCGGSCNVVEECCGSGGCANCQWAPPGCRSGMDGATCCCGSLAG